MATTTLTEIQAQPVMETMHMRLQTKSSVNMVPHPPTMPKQRAKLRLDPQRALEPARKKLSTLESQRVMAVLMESIKRTELITSLPYILENIERFRVVLGSDLVQLLEEHSHIWKSFEELRANVQNLLEKEQDEKQDEEAASQAGEEEEEGVETEQDQTEKPEADEDRAASEVDQKSHKSSRAASVLSTGTQADEAVRNLTLVARQMQYSCKNIMRAFSQNPAAVNAVLKEQSPEKSVESREMIGEMNELKDILMGMLLTTPVEEAERNLYLKEVSERERYNAGIIQKLEAELQAAMDDKEMEIKKKNDVIRRLQADLHQIEKFSDEHIRRTKSEAEKQEAADQKNSEGKRSKLQQELSQLRTQLQNLIAEHRENEQTLRTRKYKIETEVENWIHKYDQDMGERQTEFEEIDTVYTGEKKQLNELEERFKTLEEEYNQIMEERRVARERREAAERELQMCISAATTIQAFWRSFKVRKALKSKKKKGKKGKKGKK